MESFKCRSTAQDGNGNTRRPPAHGPGFSGLCVSSSLRAEAARPPGGPWGRDPSRDTWESPEEQSQQAASRGRGETPAALTMDSIPQLRRPKAEISQEGSWELEFPRKTGPTFLRYCGYLTISFSFFLMIVFFFFFNLKIEGICHLSKRCKQYKFQVKTRSASFPLLSPIAHDLDRDS